MHLLLFLFTVCIATTSSNYAIREWEDAVTTRITLLNSLRTEREQQLSQIASLEKSLKSASSNLVPRTIVNNKPPSNLAVASASYQDHQSCELSLSFRKNTNIPTDKSAGNECATHPNLLSTGKSSEKLSE